ncbi:cation:proton antiporter [Gordonia soli]|uniref:Cation/H+ exchanger transmembrane domain-containing protein n=1 Tax=Gordonia soli NBRC 108243 TaxID=1223545 RepID=M0QJN3_9ACTN|nr:sodium:proton antiporter [Gordonia soli]GAC68664.1 hypothetical protein GS4_17_00500 [Gordonia soli NBRC 108243]
MEEILLVVVAVLGIAAAHVLGRKIRVAAPLILVVAGVIVGVMPFVPAIEVDPEWILVGVLPPLLYSAAVSMPTMDFRRDFGAISALSVLLVLVSAVIVGFFLHWVLPDVSLATGIALGAIVSPTDAVATSIGKRLGVPARVTAVLEGESMLNDATALVLLRAAVAATAASISFGGVALNFVYAVVAAVVIGGAIGWLNLRVRARVTDATVNTVISFTVPYLAYLPTEHIGASGLVAAVTAGLVTGAGSVRYLTAQHRVSDTQNWRTVEFIAEGGVFLLMGLELFGLVVDVHDDHGGVETALWIGLAALGVTMVVRAAYVVPLIWWLDKVAQRGSAIRPYLERMDSKIVRTAQKRAQESADPETETDGDTEGAESDSRSSPESGSSVRPESVPGVGVPARDRRPPPSRPPRRLRLRGRPGRRRELRRPSIENADDARHYVSRIRRRIADIDYYRAAPLGPKEASVVVWGGMRGVVTVAAAQTLPADTPSRSLLVLTAFVVAASSLILQGGTLGWLIRRLGITGASDDAADERNRLHAELVASAQQVLIESGIVDDYPWLKRRMPQLTRTPDDEEDSGGEGGGLGIADRKTFERARRAIIAAQREHLLALRDQGTYTSATLSRELAQLDAEEISLEMRAGE